MRRSICSLYSVVIALLPVIMIYNVPFINKGISTVLLGIFTPYALLRYRVGKKNISILPFFILFVYMIGCATGSYMEQFLLIIVLIHVYGAIQGALDIKVMRKTIEIVAMIGTFFVLIQTIVYYFFGVQFTYLIPELILEENRYYFTKEMGTLYRPSAFFLEPSHYVQYCSLGLLSVLFPLFEKKVNFMKVIWIMLGCLLTTSGMGIALCIGIFGWYVLFNKHKLSIKLELIFFWIFIAVIIFIILMQFSFFSMAVQRVFGEVDGYNAIWGRTLFWERYIGSLEGIEVFFGCGLTDMPDGYMTGLMEMIYSYGYIGTGLMCIVFIYILKKCKDNVIRAMCVIYCALLCIANLVGFLSLSFWFCLIITQSFNISQLGKKNMRE